MDDWLDAFALYKFCITIDFLISQATWKNPYRRYRNITSDKSLPSQTHVISW